jgi:hypothetical protein
VRRQRQRRLAQVATKAFVWVVLAIFVVTSVGVALIALK